MEKRAFRPTEESPKYPTRRAGAWTVVIMGLSLLLIAAGVGVRYRDALPRLYRRYVLRELVVRTTMGIQGSIN